MNARVIQFAQVKTLRVCPWCDARQETSDDMPAVRKFDRQHLACRAKAKPVDYTARKYRRGAE
jgi:hypothetical protein